MKHTYTHTYMYWLKITGFIHYKRLSISTERFLIWFNLHYRYNSYAYANYYNEDYRRYFLAQQQSSFYPHYHRPHLPYWAPPVPQHLYPNYAPYETTAGQGEGEQYEEDGECQDYDPSQVLMCWRIHWFLKVPIRQSNIRQSDTLIIQDNSNSNLSNIKTIKCKTAKCKTIKCKRIINKTIKHRQSNTRQSNTKQSNTMQLGFYAETF